MYKAFHHGKLRNQCGDGVLNTLQHQADLEDKSISLQQRILHSWPNSCEQLFEEIEVADESEDDRDYFKCAVDMIFNRFYSMSKANQIKYGKQFLKRVKVVCEQPGESHLQDSLWQFGVDRGHRKRSAVAAVESEQHPSLKKRRGNGQARNIQMETATAVDSLKLREELS